MLFLALGAGMCVGSDNNIEDGRADSTLRICPGKLFAEQTMWLTMASILSAFDIKPPLDDNGIECMPRVAFTSGMGMYADGNHEWSAEN